MVNDRHENYDDEESEYQFTDDQINYDVETEKKPDDTTQVKKTTLPDFFKNVLTKLTPYRRMLIGIVVFFVILFIVYKMLSPGTTTTPPSTEFTPNSVANPIPPAPATVAHQPVVPAGKVPSIAPTPKAPPPLPAPVAEAPQPIAAAPAPTPAPEAPQPIAQMPTQPTPALQPSAPVAVSPTPTEAPSQLTQAPPPVAAPQPQMQMNPQSQQVSMQAPPPAQGLNPPMQQMPVNPPPPSTSMQTPPPQLVGTQSTDVVSKLSALESQNANMMNTIQTQFAQKMSDYEMQNKELQEKVIILDKRLGNMEATLNKMAQIVEGGSVKRRVVGVPAAPKVHEPKMIYSVQAIIPGRAWLKSESGDTVTVAEGDLLKDYGKIVKIDPYDGVVQIDNGNRIISLSYGTGSE